MINSERVQRNCKITYEQARRFFGYCPSNGELIWRVNYFSNKKGRVVGSIVNGYLRVKIARIDYNVSHLVWLWCYGYLPEQIIDHINLVRNDNRIENLRLVSKQCNAFNTGNQVNSTSGIKGVTYRKDANKWQVDIRFNYKSIYLGMFSCKVEASCHRLYVEQCLGVCHENSPALNYVNNYLMELIK